MQAQQDSPHSPTINEALTKLKNKVTLSDSQSFELYNAGMKLAGGRDYSRIFARDGLTSAFLLGNPRFLHDLLLFCAQTMGSKIDARTGEEPGKVLHEWPGMEFRGQNSQYAAADTTALWLVGLHEYWLATKDVRLLTTVRPQINLALSYLKMHLHDDLFWDDPKYYHAETSALLSGCWRDGGYAERVGGHQAYPASYFMVNLLIVKALRGLNALRQQLTLDDKTDLGEFAERIKTTTLQKFYLPQLGHYSSMIDQNGVLTTLYLDSIWSLYWLEPADLSDKVIEGQLELVARLQTPYGYLSRDQAPVAADVEDRLTVGHAVWPLEQAYLALLADRHSQSQIVDQCHKTAAWLDTTTVPYCEYVALNPTTEAPQTTGCDIQLWTIAYHQIINQI